MRKEIAGNIPYTLKISDKEEWTIEYGSETDTELQTLHNDMASLAIAQRVMEICAVRLREEKNITGGKKRKWLTQKLDKVVDGRFGIKIICDYFLDIYPEYIKYLESIEKGEENV